MSEHQPQILRRMAHSGFISDAPAEVRAEITKALGRAQIIVADGARQAFVRDMKGRDGQAIDEFGESVNAAPPFSNYWIEADAIGGRVGGLFIVTGETEDAWNVRASIALCKTDEPVLWPAWVTAYVVDKKTGAARDVNCRATRRLAGDRTHGAAATALLFTAHSFLNCKNIGLLPHDMAARDAKRSESRFGKRDGGYRFHTLVVRSGHDYRSPFVGTGEAGTTPLHVCRGHFKNYTAAAPLFGKYVGRFFWNAHARGDEKNGVVDKNYAIGGGQ